MEVTTKRSAARVMAFGSTDGHGQSPQDDGKGAKRPSGLLYEPSVLW
jgi:hypothetical protein